MSANTILATILAFVCIGFVADRVLDILNLRRMKPDLPERLRPFYDEDRYQKSQAYLREKSRVSLLGALISFALTLTVLALGLLGALDNWLRLHVQGDFALTLAFFGIVAVASDLLSTPFSLYNTFVIEAKYGFNKTTLRTWLLDKLKGALVGATIGAAVMWIFLWLVAQWQADFWIWFWVVITVFMLGFQFVYTSLIVPLFNKLTPLEAGPLREAIESYCRGVGFPMDNLMVMDGSKRSTKANAFFSGFGPKKRIVLFDTLIAQMSTEEIVAVLAHEVGHYKRRHIIQGMVIGVLNMGVVLFVLSRLLFEPALSQALGAHEHGIHLGLVAFALLFSPLSQLTGLGMNLLSRKNEYEADAYARETFAGEPLQSALIKLHVENLSNLEPHPAYVFLHYSHPTLLQRLAALGWKNG